MRFFGHWFHDVLAPLTLFPFDIIQRSFIIRAFDTAVPIETIFAFGVKEEQILILHHKEWIFARNCYSTIPPPHNRHFGLMMKIVSEKLRKYYKVDSIIPSNYFITNRKPGEKRYISNMYDVYLAIKEHFINEFEVKFLPDPKEMNEMAQKWASAKLIFVVTGSTCMKSVFLKEKSVMLIALGNIMDNVQPLYAAIHEIFTLSFPVEGLNHLLRWNNYTINITIALKAFNVAAYCARHGCWNPNETFHFI